MPQRKPKTVSGEAASTSTRPTFKNLFPADQPPSIPRQLAAVTAQASATVNQVVGPDRWGEKRVSWLQQEQKATEIGLPRVGSAGRVSV